MIEAPTFTIEENEFSPEEYAALWGSDPVYDKAPRLPGDGYMFYNFNVERKDPEFLRKFVGAIERTIECQKSDPENVEELKTLLQYVKDLLEDANGQP